MLLAESMKSTCSYTNYFSKVKNWPHKVSSGHLEELEGMCSTVDGYFYPGVD